MISPPFARLGDAVQTVFESYLCALVINIKMSSSILERMRQLLESSERSEAQIGLALDIAPSGQRNKVLQQHKISHHVDEIVAANTELGRLYADEDKLMEEQLSFMSGENAFVHFYDALGKCLESHQRNNLLLLLPEEEEGGGESEGKEKGKESSSSSSLEMILSSFSGDEVFGKYLDLHALFLDYCNLPHLPSREDIDYIQYLAKFNSFFYLPEACKLSKPYAAYIAKLWDYLRTFFTKVQPLVDLSPILKDWRESFEQAWRAGKVAGWKLPVNGRGNKDESNVRVPQPLRLGMFNSREELEALGMERLKEALEALGLKCGGTLADRAERLWSVRGKKAEDIPAKLRAKKAAPVSAGVSEEEKESKSHVDSRLEVCFP